MADQDFKINIVTLADLTGIKLTQDQLVALQTAAANGNKEAISALKKLSAAQREAETAARAQTQAQVQGLRNAGAYGLIIGGVVAKAINDYAAAQNKVTKELDEQGAALVKNVQEWNKLAQAVSSKDQLASVGEKALSQIDALQKKFNDANGEALTLTETVQDLLEKFVTWTPFGTGSNQALLDEKIRGLMQDLASAQQNAAETIKRGLDQQKETHEDIDSVIERETSHLTQQQALLRNLDPRTQLQSWVAVEQTIERIIKKLAELNAQREKQVKAGEPTTKAGLLGQQEQQLQALLNSRQLTPAEQNTVAQQLIKTQTERVQQEQKDKIDAFNKDIDDRNKRWTGGVSTGVPIPPGVFPTAGVPGVPVAGPGAPAGESTTATNQQILTTLQQILAQFR